MLEVNNSPFPELTTDRLLLRRITVTDAPEIFFLRSDHTVLQHLGRDAATEIKQAEDFILKADQAINNNENILWGIAFRETPEKIIGTIGFWQMVKEHYRSEIGYVLHPAYWRKGIMKEAIIKVLEYGFTTMGLHSVEARTSPANIASAAVLVSTGFVREGYFREDFFYKGKFEDTAVYSRLP